MAAPQDRFGSLSQPTEPGPEKVTHPFKDWIFDSSKAKKGHKSIVDFKNDLNNELSKAFPASQRPYNEVNVLLLCWDETDQRNKEDLQELAKFFKDEFNYTHKIFHIKGSCTSAQKPENRNLLRGVLQELYDRSSTTSLNIVYYSGHGYSNVAKGQESRTHQYLTIYPNLSIENQPGFDPNTTPFGLPYSYILGQLAVMPGETLHILECCNGGGIALDNSNVEFLSASAAAEKAKFSPQSTGAKAAFTNAFMKSMRNMRREFGIFTTVQLYSYMVTNALNPQIFDPLLTIQPFYAAYPALRKPIKLTRLLPASQVQAQDKGKGKAIVQFKKIPGEAKVLLTVSFEDNFKNVNGMLAWFKSPDRPAWIRQIEVVGFYPATSTKVIMTMPVSLWSVLPEDPAYVFIDFIRDGDFTPVGPPQPSPQLAIPEAGIPLRPQGLRENIRPGASESKR